MRMSGRLASSQFFVLMAIGILMPISSVNGQCNPGDTLVGKDENYYYCAEAQNVQKVKESIAAVEEAALTPGCSQGDVCNFFVAKIGEVRNIPYFRDVLFPGKENNTIGGLDEQRRANDIYQFVKTAVSSRASGWHKVNKDRAQDLANQGKFVIGVAKNTDPARSGHIAIVVPAWMPKRQVTSDRGGPWVRDSQSANVSVCAGIHRFVSPTLSEPIWAVWDPD